MSAVACIVVSAIFFVAYVAVSAYSTLSIALGALFLVLGVSFVVSWALVRAKRKIEESNQKVTR